MHTPRPALRGPLDDKFIWSLVLQQRRHLLIAGGSLERTAVACRPSCSERVGSQQQELLCSLWLKATPYQCLLSLAPTC